MDSMDTIDQDVNSTLPVEESSRSEPMEIENVEDDAKSERCLKRKFNNAIEENDSKSVKLHLDALDLPKRSRLVNSKDANFMDNTPLHMAISVRKIDINESVEIIQQLLDAGADPGISNKENKTPWDLVRDMPDDSDRQSIERLFEQHQPSSSSSSSSAFKKPLSKGNTNSYDWRDSGINSSIDSSINTKIDTTINTSTIDPKTDPDLDQPKTYAASGVKRALHGTIYQAKLLGLFVQAGKENEYDFRLATEMDSAEKFDDIVFKYFDNTKKKWTIRFLQAKHKQDAKCDKITISDLKSISDKNPFSLQKYLISFCNIKESECFKEMELRDFTIITNTDFDFMREESSGDDQNTSRKTLLEKWRNFFDETRATIKDDEILYIKDVNKEFNIKFNAKEYRFSTKAKDELTKMIKSTLLNTAVNAKIIATMKPIQDKVNEIIQSNSKDDLNALGKSAEELQKECKGLQRRTYILKLAKLFSTYIKGMLSMEERKEWKNIVDSLEKTKKNDTNWKEVIKMAANKSEEFWKKANISSVNANRDVGEHLRQLHDAKNHFKNIRNETFKTHASLKENIIKLIEESSSESDIVRETLCNHSIKKKWNLETKRKLGKDMDSCISEISLVQLALNDTNIDKYLDEFTKKFRFVVRYPNEKELGDLIKAKLGDDFHVLKADLVSDSFEREMLEFLKSNPKEGSEFYSWKKADDFFKQLNKNIRIIMTSGLSKVYPEELRSYGLTTQQNLKELNDFLRSNDTIWHLQTKFTLLSAIKVLQTLESTESRAEFPYLEKDDGFMFMPLKSILLPNLQNLVLECFEGNRSHHLLVVECPVKTKVEDNLIDSLGDAILNASQKQNEKKIIIIAHKTHPLAKKFEGIVPQNDLGIHFRDLIPESRATVLERKVKFQGKKQRFDEIIDKDYTALEVIDAPSLNKMMEMLNGNKLLQIGSTAAFFPNSNKYEFYYKDRLLYRQKIKKKYFVSNIEQDLKRCWLLFITRACMADLIDLGIKKEFIRDQTKVENGCSDGFILHTSSKNATEQFNEICEHCTAKSIFWLEYIDGDLFWRDYCKELSEFEDRYIEKNYAPDESDIINSKNILKEEYFCDEHIFGQKVIIVANDSGMGKSFALSSLARKIMKFRTDDVPADLQSDVFANFWIVRIDLREHAKEGKESSIENINEDWSDSEFIDFISKMSIPGNEKNIEVLIQRKLFSVALESSNTSNGQQVKRPEILIQFDGFDEICSLSTSTKFFAHKEKTTVLLKKLKDSTNAIQLWITTRTHEKAYLEKELSSPAYMLTPLTREDQKEFSNEFWKWNLNSINEKKANDAFKKLMKRLGEIQSSLRKYSESSEDGSSMYYTLSGSITPILEMHQSDKQRNIRHLRKLRADVSKLDFSPYVNLLLTKMNIEFTNIPLHLEMLVGVISEKEIDLTKPLGLVNLYRRFVDYKLRYYLERREISDKNAPQAIPYEVEITNLQNEHRREAAFLFLSLKTSLLNTEDEKQKATKPGLLSLSDGKLEFVRPTFAEFFYTEYLVKKWKNKGTQTVLFTKLLVEKRYEPVRKLFNGQIELFLNFIEFRKTLRQDLRKCKISDDEHDKELSSYEGKHVGKLLNSKITSEVEKMMKDSIDSDDTNVTFLHVLAEEYRTATIQFVLDKFKNNKSILKKLIQKTDKQYNKTALQLAVNSDIPGDCDCAGTVKVLLTTMKNCLDENELNRIFLANEADKIDDAHESLLHITTILLGKKETFDILLEWMKLNLRRSTFSKVIQAKDKSGKTVKEYLSNFEMNLLPKSISREDCEKMSKSLRKTGILDAHFPSYV